MLREDYADLAQQPRFGPLVVFFFQAIYAPRDFGERNESFRALHRWLVNLVGRDPVQVLANAIELYELTESLDDDMVLALRTLKVILWQLPPSLHRDLERLEAFLARLPRTVRHAVEFRHESWWDDEVAQTLERHAAALVAVSHPRLPDAVIPTTDLLYLRFHGLGQRLYDYDYSNKELGVWARRLRPCLAGRTLYAFFNNDYHANAPRNAAELRGLLSRWTS